MVAVLDLLAADGRQCAPCMSRRSGRANNGRAPTGRLASAGQLYTFQLSAPFARLPALSDAAHLLAAERQKWTNFLRPARSEPIGALAVG